MKDYLVSHWAGHQSLTWVCCVNLLGIGAGLVFSLQELVPDVMSIIPDQSLLLFVLLLIVSVALIAGWQIVGTVRTCHSEWQETSAAGDSWVIYLLSAIYACFLLVSLLDLSKHNLAAPPESVPLPTTVLSHHSLGTREIIQLSGSLEFGLTRNLESMLQEYPAVTGLVLDSEGGVVSEARGVARVVRENNLSTRVDNRCYSSCTLIFISSDRRAIGPAGKLGFHQYAVADSKMVLQTDPDQEQARDADIFLDQGVSPEFVERLYSEPHSSLWEPTRDEMLQFGLITVPVE